MFLIKIRTSLETIKKIEEKDVDKNRWLCQNYNKENIFTFTCISKVRKEPSRFKFPSESERRYLENFCREREGRDREQVRIASGYYSNDDNDVARERKKEVVKPAGHL